MSEILCPYCNQKLEFIDFLGRLNFSFFGDLDNDDTHFKRVKNIYRCSNSDCRSGQFDYYFYSKVGNDKLFAGYPC